MQQELKFEAFRIETLRKSVDTACFDRCVPAPANLSESLAFALPPRVPLLQSAPSEHEARAAADLSASEAVCIDRCAWKYMLTSKIVLQTLSKARNVKEPAAGRA